MKKFKIVTALVLAILMLFTIACGNDEDVVNDGETVKFTDIKLADSGVTDYTIIISKDADECIQYAAEELQKYFNESTSAKIAIESDAGKSFSSNEKFISLGNTSIKDDAGINTLTEEEANLDGFKLVRKDKSMFIVGYVSRGVLYGVYEFLNYAFGYEAYTIDETSLNYNTTAYLPDLNVTEVPSFRGRNMDGPITRAQEFTAKARIKQVGTDLTPKYGGGSKDEYLFNKTSHCEWSFFREDGYLQQGDRPEILTAEMKALNNQHICWTNAEVIDLIVERAIRQLEAQPSALYVNFAEEDNAMYCNCERASTSYCGMGCKESTAKFGASGTLIRFVNEIVKKIEAWREVNCAWREIKYVTMGYSGTIVPPVFIDDNGNYVIKDESCRPHEKLYLKFTPLGRCCYHAFYDNSCALNAGRANNWAGWRAITDRLMVYDYLTNFDDYYTFFNNYNVVQNELIEYHEAGVIDYYGQYTSASSFSTMSDLNNYLYSKLLWNVYEDSNKLINDFMNAYYKEGAPYMMEYFNLMRSHIDSVAVAKDNNFHMTTYTEQTASYYNTDQTWPKAVLEKALSLIEKASAMYDSIEDKELRSKLKVRVLKESFCVRFTILKNYGKYYSYASPEYTVFKNQWTLDASETLANYYQEGQTVSNFISLLPA